MGWIEPKIDWLPTQEGVGDGDFNRIEGNIKFLSENGGVIGDVEGNAYRTVTINGQAWTVDNWKCTKYADGTDIPYIPDQVDWDAAFSPGYCRYDGYVTKFGLLYNAYAAKGIGYPDIAPDGWRVPTESDITVLNTFLAYNGYNYDHTNVADKTAKSMASVVGWDLSSSVGRPGQSRELNNESGLSFSPGGYRNTAFVGLSTTASIWTSESISKAAQIYYNQPDLSIITESSYVGMSIKLVRDI